MHDYLRAVGFSKVQHKRDLQRLLDMVMGSPDSEFASGCGGTVYAEKCRDFVSNAGITVRGEVDEHGMFSYEYYFPHIQVIRFRSQMMSVLRRFLKEKNMMACVMW